MSAKALESSSGTDSGGEGSQYPQRPFALKRRIEKKA